MGGEKPFAGKVAVVTGSTQGLGEAIAGSSSNGRRLAWCHAAATGRTARRWREPWASTGQGPVRARPSSVNAAGGDLVAAATRRSGGSTYWSTPRRSPSAGTILDTTPELFDRMFAVNVRAPFFLMQEAVRS